MVDQIIYNRQKDNHLSMHISQILAFANFTIDKLANASYNISIPIQQGIKSLMIIVPQSKAKVNEKEEKI